MAKTGEKLDSALSTVGTGVKYGVSGITGGTVGLAGGAVAGAVAGPFVGAAKGAEKGFNLPDKLWAPTSIIGRGIMAIPKLVCSAVGLSGGAVAGAIAGPFVGAAKGAKKGFNVVKDGIETVTMPEKAAQKAAQKQSSQGQDGQQEAGLSAKMGAGLKKAGKAVGKSFAINALGGLAGALVLGAAFGPLGLIAGFLIGRMLAKKAIGNKLDSNPPDTGRPMQQWRNEMDQVKQQVQDLRAENQSLGQALQAARSGMAQNMGQSQGQGGPLPPAVKPQTVDKSPSSQPLQQNQGRGGSPSPTAMPLTTTLPLVRSSPNPASPAKPLQAQPSPTETVVGSQPPRRMSLPTLPSESQVVENGPPKRPRRASLGAEPINQSPISSSSPQQQSLLVPPPLLSVSNPPLQPVQQLSPPSSIQQEHLSQQPKQVVEGRPVQSSSLSVSTVKEQHQQQLEGSRSSRQSDMMLPSQRKAPTREQMEARTQEIAASLKKGGIVAQTNSSSNSGLPKAAPEPQRSL